MTPNSRPPRGKTGKFTRKPPALGGNLAPTTTPVVALEPPPAVNQPIPTAAPATEPTPPQGLVEAPQVAPQAAVTRSPAPGPDEPPPVKRGRGRPPGSGSKRQAPSWDLNPGAPGGIPDTRAITSMDRDKQYVESAKMIVGTTTGALEMLGEHWKPTAEEQHFLNDATARYLKAKQLPDLPPGWVLLGAIAIYAIPRVMHEKTQAQLAQLMGRTNAGP